MRLGGPQARYKHEGRVPVILGMTAEDGTSPGAGPAVRPARTTRRCPAHPGPRRPSPPYGPTPTPSVRDRDSIDAFVADLAGARPATLVNPYADEVMGLDRPGAAAIRCANLRADLEARVGAPLALIGEATAAHGARFSGIAFTAERSLAPEQRTSAAGLRPDGFTEHSATVLAEALIAAGIDATEVALWTAVPFHPARASDPLRNRTPRVAERAPSGPSGSVGSSSSCSRDSSPPSVRPPAEPSRTEARSCGTRPTAEDRCCRPTLPAWPQGCGGGPILRHHLLRVSAASAPAEPALRAER